ncbi:MAG: hypothetical protein ABW321_06140, partial [Polyangiales bacterium]
ERPLTCPPGTERRVVVEAEVCVQSCRDARGAVVARSVTMHRGELDVSPQPSAAENAVRTRLFWDRRLVCTYRGARAEQCTFDGAAIELGALRSAIASRWQVTHTEGSAPTVRGASCELEVRPFSSPVSDGPPANCRLNLRCGHAIYGAGTSGYGLCDVAAGQVRGAIDFGASHVDGDPQLVLDLARDRLLVADRTWKVMLTPVQPLTPAR